MPLWIGIGNYYAHLCIWKNLCFAFGCFVLLLILFEIVFAFIRTYSILKYELDFPPTFAFKPMFFSLLYYTFSSLCMLHFTFTTVQYYSFVYTYIPSLTASVFFIYKYHFLISCFCKSLYDFNVRMNKMVIHNMHVCMPYTQQEWEKGKCKINAGKLNIKCNYFCIKFFLVLLIFCCFFFSSHEMMKMMIVSCVCKNMLIVLSEFLFIWRN